MTLLSGRAHAIHYVLFGDLISRERMEKGHQGIDFAFVQVQGEQFAVSLGAIVELHDLFQRGDGAVMHVGRR